MLSVVLYGRNDSYGYNLHKRAALALNCLAEILTDESDEIVFVDYNTPDDYPTFPEAIGDTLAAKTKARLRILRVRPAIHDRWKERTHLEAIEPVARNVAVRRSNPRNRWILSTNTDMIFVPRVPWVSLSDIVSDLPDGFYHLPRFELPESLWEGFDRTDPVGVIEQVRTLGRSMFLNEIVCGTEIIKYDGPGDFQLVMRDDLFRIHGFNEEMLLGWHVDYNLARRLHLLHGNVGDVVERLFGYHCDHTRQITAAHQHDARRNDTAIFVDRVTDPMLSAQAGSWGCAADDIEEIGFAQSTQQVFVSSLRAAVAGEWAEPVTVHHTPDSFDQVSYDARHVLPFLTDLFVSAPRQWTLGWIGGRTDTFLMFLDVWRRFGFTGGILIEEWSSPLLSVCMRPEVRIAHASEIDAAADVLVFDFGAPSASPNPLERSVAPARLDHVIDKLARQSFLALVADERARLRAGARPRRIICINAIHNRYEALVKGEIGFASTPFATRLRHGFVTPRAPNTIFIREDESQGAPDEKEEKPNLLDRMHTGHGGKRVRAGVLAPFGRRGYVISGPYDVLPSGRYRVEFSLRSHGLFSVAAFFRPIIVEVVEGAKLLAQARLTFFMDASPSLTFSVEEDGRPDAERGIGFRIFSGRLVEFVITSVRLIQLSTPRAPLPEASAARGVAKPTNPLLEALGITANEAGMTV